MASSHLIYLGTYTKSGDSAGIYAVRLDGESGALDAPALAATATDPTWLALSPDKAVLYANHASAAQVIGFAVEPGTARLNPLPGPPATASALRASAPSFIAVDATGRAVLAANYHDGFVAGIPIQPDHTLGAAQVLRHEGRSVHPTRQDKSHVHSVTLSPDNRFALVADLGLDRIFSYALDPASATLAPAEPPFVAAEPGAGPRHAKFSREGRHVYVINELNNTIAVYDYAAAQGALTLTQTVPTLPVRFRGQSTAAEVRVHPAGGFVYGSNRGDDSLAVFKIDPASGHLTLVEIVPSGGKTPRNFDLSPDGKWLVCGHQDTPALTVFAVDGKTGRLTRTPHTARVPSCVCVLFYD